MDLSIPIKQALSSEEIHALSTPTGFYHWSIWLLIGLMILGILSLGLLSYGADINDAKHKLGFNTGIATLTITMITIIIIIFSSVGPLKNHNKGLTTQSRNIQKTYKFYQYHDQHNPGFEIGLKNNKQRTVPLTKNTVILEINQDQPERFMTNTQFTIPAIKDEKNHGIFDFDNNNGHKKTLHAKKQTIIVFLHNDHFKQVQHDQKQLK